MSSRKLSMEAICPRASRFAVPAEVHRQDAKTCSSQVLSNVEVAPTMLSQTMHQADHGARCLISLPSLEIGLQAIFCDPRGFEMPHMCVYPYQVKNYRSGS